MYKRGVQHVQVYRLMEDSSFMLRHHLNAHPDTKFGELKFLFKPLTYHESAFRRQIDEAVSIKLSINNPLKANINNKLKYCYHI